MLLQVGTVGTQFKGIMRYMEEWGVFDAFLPFLLFFTIIFAILQQTAIFKDEAGTGANRKINAIIAFSLSALVVLPHVLGAYPKNSDPIVLLYKFLPSTIIIIVVILFVLFMTGLVSAEIPNILTYTIGFIGVVVLIGIFLINVFPAFSLKKVGPLSDPSFQALIVILLVFGLVVFFITKGDREKKWPEWVSGWFGAPPPPQT